MKTCLFITIAFVWTTLTIAQNTTTYQYDNQNRLTHSTEVNTTNQYSFDELGNRLQLVVTNQSPQGADLTISNLDIPSSTLEQGTSLLVSCDINNTGMSNAGGSYLKVYLASTATGTDTELTSHYLSDLPAGGSETLSLELTIPQDAPTGNRYLVFFADATLLVTETNETNNKANEPVFIQTQSAVDLTIQNQQANPTSLFPGESTYISASMMNQGNVVASNFWLRCYLSFNPTFESFSDVELTDAAFHFTSLNAGAGIAYAMNVNIPVNTIPGNYFLLFVADPENNVSEQDENNNVSYVALSIQSQGGGSSPVSNFSVDNSFIGAGTTVHFTDLSTNNPTSWQWSFPGGTPAFSTAQNPSINYGSNGIFDVSLTSSNSSGSNTVTQSNYISVGQVPEYDWIWSQGLGIDINDLTIDSDGNIVVAGGDASTMYYAKHDPEGNVIWSNTVNNCRGRAMDVSTAGDIFIVGEFAGTVNFGNNVSINNTYNDGWDGYIAKFDENGLCLWANKIYNSDIWNTPNSQTIILTDVCIDIAGNSYVTGYYEGLYGGSDYNNLHFPNGITLQNINQSYNLIVAKFSPPGSTLWAKQGNDYNNTTCYFEGAAIDTDGSHVGVVGQFSGTAIFNNQNGYTRTASGRHDIFFIECSTADGYMNAFLQYGSNNTSTNSWDYERGNDIKYSSSGVKFICGQFSGNAQFGVFQRSSTGHADAFLMKVSSSSSTQWVVTGGSTNFDCGNDISITPNGDIYMVGQHDAGFVTDGLSIDGYGTYINIYNADGTVKNADNVMNSFYNDNNGGGIEADSESNLFFGTGNTLSKYGTMHNILSPELQCTQTSFCSGDSTLIVAPENFETYLWSNGETTSTILVESSGDYFVEVTDAYGGRGYSDTLTIEVYDYPSAIISFEGSGTFCEGSGIELAANTGDSLTYRWIKNNDYISGATDSVYQAMVSGFYKVEVSTSGNCPVESDSVVLTSEPSFAYISVLATATQINEGEEVTFSTIPINEGSTPHYQWLINQQSVGADSPVFVSSSLENGDSVSCTLIASGSCIANNPVLSNTTVMTVFPVQNIDLFTGWNIISFGILPIDNNMLNMLQPLADNNSLLKVINESGGFIQYIPGVGWLNTIGDMAITEGYYLKVSADDNLSVAGIRVTPPVDIPLQTGWNIMGYPVQNSQNAITALQPLVNQGSLVKVINEAGGFIQYIPGLGWFNTIGSFDPGEGYYIKVSSNDTLTLTNPITTAPQPHHTIKEGSFFRRAIEGNPYQPMHIAAAFSENIQLVEGDELAVFAGDQCLGSSLVEDFSAPVAVFLTTDDPTTEIIDGGQTGDVLTFKLFHQGKTYLLECQNHQSVSYEPLETQVVNFTTTWLDVSTTVTAGFMVSEVIPNPFSTEARIYVTIPETGNLKIEVLDLRGVVIKTLFESEVDAQKLEVKIEGKELRQGMYFVHVRYNNENTQEEVLRKVVMYE